MNQEQDYIYRTTECVNGMNPLNYFDPAEISARLNTVFNKYLESENDKEELKRNHWLIACVSDFFQGVTRCDELLPDEDAL